MGAIFTSLAKVKQLEEENKRLRSEVRLFDNVRVQVDGNAGGGAVQPYPDGALRPLQLYLAADYLGVRGS